MAVAIAVLPVVCSWGQDTDRDGMPDSWETQHQLNPNSGLLPSLVGWWPFDEGSGFSAANEAGTSFLGRSFRRSASAGLSAW
jgi:hypothetical protein